MHFADTLIAKVRQLGHLLCAGLDPHLERVPPIFRRGTMDGHDPETAEAVRDLGLAFLDRLAGRVAVIKPQIAFFEQLGSAGVRVLEELAAAARERELLVLLDAKRGDIGSTAEGYARAYLEPGAACEADAITLSPYLGRDTLEPFAERAEAGGQRLLGLLDHVEADAILDAPSGIPPLVLAVDLGHSLLRDAVETHERRATDQLPDVVGDLHEASGLPARIPEAGAGRSATGP